MTVIPVMASQRELRRVPLDFDCPPGSTWEGFLVPKALWPTPCPVCRERSYLGEWTPGDGFSREARALAETFYANGVHNADLRERIAWCDKISQDEVDNLVARGRLSTWGGRSLPTVRHPHGRGFWLDLPRSAAEINAENAPGARGFGHDAINRHMLIRFRCERLGLPVVCPGCEGEGSVWDTPEAEAAYEAWTPTDPPTGEGFQLWQTVSEGGPCSPVLGSLNELAAWLSANDTSIHRDLSAEEWLRVMGGEAHGIDVRTGRAV